MPLKKKKTKTLLDQLAISGGCFFAGVICLMYGSSYQGQLLGTGSAQIGRNSAYVTVTGRDAQININFFWIGAVVFILASLINLIVTARREFKNPLPFEELNTFVICPKCIEPLWGKDNPSMVCTKCQRPLEDVHGFYERHPELKVPVKESSSPIEESKGKLPEIKLSEKPKLSRIGLFTLTVAIVSFTLLIYTIIKEVIKLF